MTLASTGRTPVTAAAIDYDGGLTCAINVTDLDRSMPGIVTSWE